MKTIISFIYIFYFGYSLAQVYKEPDMDCKKVEKIQYSYSVNYSIIDKYNKIDTSKNALTQEPYYTGIRNFLDTLVVDIMLEKVPAFGTDSKKMIKPFHAYESIFGDCFPEPCGTPEIEKFNYDWRDTTFMTITRHAREELTGGPTVKRPIPTSWRCISVS